MKLLFNPTYIVAEGEAQECKELLLQVYPLIMNGHAVKPESRITEAETTPAKPDGRNPDKLPIYDYIMKKVRSNVKKSVWHMEDVVELTGYQKSTCRTVINEAVKKGEVKPIRQGRNLAYSFLSDYTYGTRCQITAISEKVFNEMLLHAKPLLLDTRGCEESQVRKLFRNVKADAINCFLSMCIEKGLVTEELGILKPVIKQEVLV